MWKNLGKYIKEERLRQGLNSSELAQLMGYKNINRGMRRILDLEREGMVHPEVLKKIIKALNLDQKVIDYVVQQDKEQHEREFQEWVNTPIDMHLTVKLLPAIYANFDVPADIESEEEIIEFACDKAKELRCMLWLVLSRKENIHIDNEGKVISRNVVTKDRSFLPFVKIM